MAGEFDFESRTEAPTPRRREEAAEKGQFAFSNELNSGIVVLVGIGGLALLAHTLGGGFLAETRFGLHAMALKELSIDTVKSLFAGLMGRGVLIVGSLLGLLFVATCAVSIGQVGFRINLDRISIDWERISPMHWDRVLSWSKIVRGLFLVLKITAVGAVAWWILRQRGGAIAAVGDGGLAGTIGNSWSVIIRLALGMAATLLIIGVADYAYQRWQFERSISMTRQELKDELKREEGDPQIRARIRKMQRETSQRKMLKQVPKATIVITNPTHLAIAIQYDAVTMRAPKVVAKGAGHIAKRIVELARQHGVPIMERKPLAQALYKTAKVDREIPLAFYLVVAELLAHVYSLRGGGPIRPVAVQMN